MTFGSLFAGIGGIDLGLERAGMECLWQVEIDEYASRVLEKHWPDVQRYRDIRECGAANLAPVDLICGGFPCQPHSLAGKRQASEDERDLWGEMFRVICEVRPRWVLAENVPGLLSSEAGRFFGRVLRDLAGVGFDVEWESIPAAAVGAPHRRDRVFIVAHCDRKRCAKWSESNSLSIEPKQQASRRSNACRCSENVADSSGTDAGSGSRFSQGSESIDWKSTQFLPDAGCRSGETEARDHHGETMADAEGTGFAPCAVRQRQEQPWRRDSGRVRWWEVEPDVGRVADGVPSRVDRLRCLGNAVVPQVAEWIGRRIVEEEERGDVAHD